jgi:hypothetical protein
MSPKTSNDNVNADSEWEFANEIAALKKSSSSSDSVFLKSSRNGLADDAALAAKINALEQKRPLIYALTADIDPSIAKKIARYGFKKAFDILNGAAVKEILHDIRKAKTRPSHLQLN